MNVVPMEEGGMEPRGTVDFVGCCMEEGPPARNSDRFLICIPTLHSPQQACGMPDNQADGEDLRHPTP